MDSLFPPTALYAVLAVAVAVTARVTTQSPGGRCRINPWSWLGSIELGFTGRQES